MNQSGAIIDSDSEVIGYYFVTRLEKERRVRGKKKPQIVEELHLELYDIELSKIGEKVYRQEGISVRDVVYNGTYLAVKLVNHESERKWIEILDAEAEVVSRASLSYTPFDREESYSGSEVFQFKSLSAVPDGFVNVDSGAEKMLNKTKYNIKFIPNDEDADGWTSRTSARSKDFEGANFIFANENMVICDILVRPSLLKLKFESTLIGFDKTTGDKIFEYKTDEGANSIRYTSGSQVDDQIIIAGLDVGSSNKVYTEKPMGINAVWLSSKGEKIDQKRFDLEYIYNQVDLGPGNLYVHDILVTSEGEFVLIGEMYKSFNGGLTTLNGILIHLDKDLSYKSTMLIEKKGGSTGRGLATTLNGGFSMARKELIAAKEAVEGGMDMSMIHQETDALIVAFFAGRKEFKADGRQASVYIATVTDGEMKQEKMLFEPDSDGVWLFPCRSGYITVVEYNGDSGALNAHIERLDN